MENITEVLMESVAKAEKMIAAEEPAPGDYRKDAICSIGTLQLMTVRTRA